MRRILLSLLLAVAVAGPGVPGTGVAEAAEATVTFAYRANPATLTVAPGTTVTFANASGERRRVRSEDGPGEIDSGNLEPGVSWSIVLHAAGTYSYVDDRDRDDTAYHGTITVAAPTQPTGGSGGAPPVSSAPSGAPACSAAGSSGPRRSARPGSSRSAAPSTRR